MMVDYHVFMRNPAGRPSIVLLKTPSFTAGPWVKGAAVLLAAGLVAVTGWNQSPLVFLLYVPILMFTLRGQATAGFMIAVATAAAFITGVCRDSSLTKAGYLISVEFSFTFPAVAAFTILLTRRTEERLRLLSNRTKELRALLDMSQMMDSAFDLDMTLNLILLNAKETTNCSVCAVYLKDPTGKTLEPKATSGPNDRTSKFPDIGAADARCGSWSVDKVAAPGQMVDAYYAPDTGASKEASDCRLFEVDRASRSFCCLPLTSVEGTLGMLYLGFDAANGLKQSDIARLKNLATRAAFPLQRVILQEGFQSLAFRDQKTGLDNFRQFEMDLSNELNRAERYGHRLSVLLLDIDHFKQFNDEHGHPAGDAVLAQIGVILRNSLRSADKPARYGGEEFVIVCPETGKDEARLVSERIRKNVSETDFAFVPREGLGTITRRLTVSVGHATFPLDAHHTQELTQKADDALYAAKHAGRNTVRGYGDINRRTILL